MIGVLEYNVQDKEWNKFMDYPGDFSPDLHGNCINIKKRNYIFMTKAIWYFRFGIKEMEYSK